jgi:hypothetical protein
MARAEGAGTASSGEARVTVGDCISVVQGIVRVLSFVPGKVVRVRSSVGWRAPVQSIDLRPLRLERTS